MAILDQLKALARGTNTGINRLLGVGQPRSPSPTPPTAPFGQMQTTTPATSRPPTLTAPQNFLGTKPLASSTPAATSAALSKPVVAPVAATVPRTPSGLTEEQALAIQRMNQTSTPAAPSAPTLTEAEKRHLASLEESPEEVEARRMLGNLIASKELGLAETANRPIAMPFITGQQSAIERRAAVQSVPLEAQLSSLAASREARTARASAEVDIERGRQPKVVSTQTDAAGNINLITQNSDGSFKTVPLGKIGQPQKTTSGTSGTAGGIADAIIANPTLYSGLSQTVKGQVLAELSSRGVDTSFLTGNEFADVYTQERQQRIIDTTNEFIGKIDSGEFITGRRAAFEQELKPYLQSNAYRNSITALDTLKSNIAFAELQEMRNASKTGGALGQVAIRELELLESTLGAVNLIQDKEQMKASLQKIQDSILRWNNLKKDLLGVKTTVDTSEADESATSGVTPSGIQYQLIPD